MLRSATPAREAPAPEPVPGSNVQITLSTGGRIGALTALLPPAENAILQNSGWLPSGEATLENSALLPSAENAILQNTYYKSISD